MAKKKTKVMDKKKTKSKPKKLTVELKKDQNDFSVSKWTIRKGEKKKVSKEFYNKIKTRVSEVKNGK